MANIDNSERIERYLREQMTPEENDTFLNDLKNDKDLHEEAQMMALMIKEMKDEQVKRDTEVTEKILAAEEQRRKHKIISIVRWSSLSIAAMFILVFGVTTLWNRQSETDVLFSQYYSTYDITPSKGGDDEAIKTELAELYNTVGTDKDISSVINRLQTIYDNIQANDEEFDDYRYYESDIAWYLALAYLKNGNLDKTKELLKPLADNGDVDAIKLLKDLNDL